MRISDWSSDVCSSDLRALGEHPEEDAGGGRGEGVDQSEAGRTIGFERRSGVEAEPAHPQEAGADQRHGQRVRRHDVLLIRSEEHTSELQSLMRISYAVFCLKKKQNKEKR